jgi:hypothetical protein
MRRLNADAGAAATLVVVVLAMGSLLGLGAVVLDFGSVMAERRQLQNGADAAALAIARDCAEDAATCDTSEAAAGVWVDLNDAGGDLSGDAGVYDVCTGAGTAAPCLDPAGGGALADCLPPEPGASWSGFVEVRTQTSVVPPLMGQVLGSPGKSAAACARAAWGPVGSLTTIPVTFSLCEWQSMTSNGTNFAPAPEPDGSYPGGYPTSYQRKLHTHQGASGSAAGTCDPGPAYSDIPGGFGWLEPDGADCEAYYEVGGGPSSDTGASLPAECRTDIAPLVGHVVYIPIFTAVTGVPDRVYDIEGFAAFYLTGYGRIPSASPPRVPSIAGGGHLCTGSEHCLYGWFTESLGPPDSGIGSGPDYGLSTSELSG